MTVNGDVAAQQSSLDLDGVRASGRVQPGAPGTGRCARGNGGRHLLWVDPDRDPVIASHWGNRVAELITEITAAVPATATR